MSRLNVQRVPTGRIHRRFNYRFMRRGYPTNPHDIWGDWALKNTTGTAGTPGSFSGGGTGATAPYDLTQLIAWGVTASPTSTWTVGQRVVLGNGLTAHWHTTNGWTAGNAP